ncbi:hypothetical protein HED60_19090 [Planctomycetales bacterium ZRK34]|nr:hypothetical protein HED60_19090 [Planctomycetales bacterium ZRK34]
MNRLLSCESSGFDRYLPLCVVVLCVAFASSAQAVVHQFDYSGVIVAIMGADGNAGGAFTLPDNTHVQVGDTYHGTGQWDSDDLETTSTPFAGMSNYEYRPASPALTIDTTASVLTDKLGLSYLNDLDPNDPLFPNHFTFGLEQTGVPLTGLFDYFMLFGDVQFYDTMTSTGTEFILVTFDPTGAALSDTALPASPQPLSNQYFILLETVNGETTAAAIGLIPEPATAALLVMLSAAALRRSHRHSN